MGSGHLSAVGVDLQYARYTIYIVYDALNSRHSTVSHHMYHLHCFFNYIVTHIHVNTPLHGQDQQSQCRIPRYSRYIMETWSCCSYAVLDAVIQSLNHTRDESTTTTTWIIVFCVWQRGLDSRLYRK